MTLLTDLSVDCLAIISHKLDGCYLHRLAATGDRTIRTKIACGVTNVEFSSSYAIGFWPLPFHLFSLLDKIPLHAKLVYFGLAVAPTGFTFGSNVASLHFVNLGAHGDIKYKSFDYFEFAESSFPPSLTQLCIVGHIIRTTQLGFLPKTIEKLTITLKPKKSVSFDAEHTFSHLRSLSCLSLTFTKRWCIELFTSIPSTVTTLFIGLRAKVNPFLDDVLFCAPKALERLHINHIPTVWPSPTPVDIVIPVLPRLRQLSLMCFRNSFRALVPFLASGESHSLAVVCAEFLGYMPDDLTRQSAAARQRTFPFIWWDSAEAVHLNASLLAHQKEEGWADLANDVKSYFAPSLIPLSGYGITDWRMMEILEDAEPQMAVMEPQTGNGIVELHEEWTRRVEESGSRLKHVALNSPIGELALARGRVTNAQVLTLSQLRCYGQSGCEVHCFVHLDQLNLFNVNVTTLEALFDGDASPSRTDYMMPTLRVLLINVVYNDVTIMQPRRNLRMRQLPSNLEHLSLVAHGIHLDPETMLPMNLDTLKLEGLCFTDVEDSNLLDRTKNLLQLIWEIGLKPRDDDVEDALVPQDLEYASMLDALNISVARGERLGDFNLPFSLRSIYISDGTEALSSTRTSLQPQVDEFISDTLAFFESRRPTLTWLNVNLAGCWFTKTEM